MDNTTIINIFNSDNDNITYIKTKNRQIINIFKSDNSNITYIKTKYRQIMTTIAYRILKFESMIKKPIVKNHAFFTPITFSCNNPFAYINYILIQH